MVYPGPATGRVDPHQDCAREQHEGVQYCGNGHANVWIVHYPVSEAMETDAHFGNPAIAE